MRGITLLFGAVLIAGLFVSGNSQTFPISLTIQAEDHTARQGGIFDPPGAPTSPGSENDDHRTAVQKMANGSWLRFDSIPFYNGIIDSIAFYYWASWDASLTNASVTFHIDSLNGPSIGSSLFSDNDHTVNYPSGNPAGSRLIPIRQISGFHTLFIAIQGSSSVYIFDIDRIELRGSFVASAADACTYYVATTGSDDSTGLTLTKPFKTIQKAASVMKPGSTCKIRAGVYRETVRPLYTGVPGLPITFEAYNNENVVISGADLVSSQWTNHSGNIYRTSLAKSPLGKYRDQLLIDGNMAWVARSPNANDAYKLNPSLIGGRCIYRNWLEWQQKGIYPLVYPAVVGLGDNGSVWPQLDYGGAVDFSIMQEYENQTEYAIPSILLGRPTNFFKGGLINTLPGYWNSHAEITASRTDGVKTVVEGMALSSMNADHGTGGWISYVFGLLDAPNEWYRDSAAGVLYLYAPDGGDPSHHTIEIKKRYLGFDLNSKNYIHITGLKFLATSMVLGDASHCIIDRCYFKHISHYDTFNWWEIGDPYNLPFNPTRGDFGIYVSGSENVISNSSIAISAGSGVILSGKRNTVLNCRIHDCNYGGGYFGAVTIMKRDWHNTQDAYNLLVSKNSLYNCQRAVMQVASASPGTSVANFNKIEYNDFGVSCFRGAEAAQVSGQSSGNIEISHNWFHDVSGFQAGFLGPEGDMGGRSWITHHNVFWQGAKTSEGYNGSSTLISYHYVTDVSDSSIGFNNTIVDSTNRFQFDDYTAGHRDWDTIPASMTNKFNDIYGRSDTAYWKYQNPAQNDYRLRADSPARGKGTPLPAWAIAKYGLTPSYTGATTDLGAYQYGEGRWAAGADWQETPWVYPPNTGSAIYPSDYAFSKVSPMPHLAHFKNRLVIRATQGSAYQIQLFNTQGALLRQETRPEGGTYSMSLKPVPAGTYLVKIQCQNKTAAHTIIMSK